MINREATVERDLRARWVEQAAGLLAEAARLGLSAASAAAFWSAYSSPTAAVFAQRLRCRVVKRFRRAAGNNGPAAVPPIACCAITESGD